MILRTIGQGGMGAVYQARDLKNQSTCAVKEMSLSMLAPEEREQAIANFRGEATLLSQLHHVNLPTFTDFFTEGPRYFLVMEYIDGNTLEEYLSRNSGPFPERRVLNWARQLCDVLEYLHSQHPPIIFRDMKPGNIMLMRNGRIKLIDFGIARFVRHSSSHDTQLLGTPGYAPPEQYGKAQTDERSDIYSLAITLFQLMTNTLSENGFGLKDVHAINPSISPVVARALEKATALAPEERFQDVESFRRALLGVGTFVFEDGAQATTPEELAELCARYPQEGADYLFAGEIESWLREIGEPDLVRATQQIRTAVSDPQEGVERFLRMVMGPSARTRTSPAIQRVGNSQTGRRIPTMTGSRISRGRLSRGRPSAPTVVVSPQKIDFGQVYPGVSSPISLSISGHKGASVRGTIHVSDPWIRIDQAQFDGMITRVNVRVESSRLRDSTEYTGTIQVMPEDSDQQIPVTVTVEVLGWDITATMMDTPGRAGRASPPDPSARRHGRSDPRGRPGGALDDEDDWDATAGSTTVQGGMPMSGTGQQTAPALKGYPRSMVGAPLAGALGGGAGILGGTASIPYTTAKDEEYKAKYGPPNRNAQPGQSSLGWDPLQASPQQRLWMQRGLIFFAAFMGASLFYTVLSHVQTSILSPSPWFIVVLVGILPSATLGALLLSWNRTWQWRDTINRASTGIFCALLALSFSELTWQSVLQVNNPPLQLVIMLLVTALGATIGTNPSMVGASLAGALLKSVVWAVTHLRGFMFAAAALIGGCLGYVLTAGFALGCFTPFGVVLGIGVAVALILRVDRMIPHP